MQQKERIIWVAALIIVMIGALFSINYYKVEAEDTSLVVYHLEGIITEYESVFLCLKNNDLFRLWETPCNIP